jgi:DNA-binding NarL/FixJ family response regulator
VHGNRHSLGSSEENCPWLVRALANLMMPEMSRKGELKQSSLQAEPVEFPRAPGARQPLQKRPAVIIADDHLMMAQALAHLLRDDCDVISAVNNAHELLAIAAKRCPDLVLMDVCMPNLTGMEATRKLLQIAPRCKVILVSMYAQPEFVREAFTTGASGYLLKSSAAAELQDAIREVMNGNVYVSSCIAKDVLASLLLPPPPALSLRQREVLALVAEGCSAKEIAGRLRIKVKTAQFHRANIMVKLRIHTTAELTKYALGHGIIS